MNQILLIILGVLAFLTVQAIGLALIAAVDRDEAKEAGIWWLGLTGWLIWGPMYLWRAAADRHTRSRRG